VLLSFSLLSILSLRFRVIFGFRGEGVQSINRFRRQSQFGSGKVFAQVLNR
jgi:hypothetical protein